MRKYDLASGALVGRVAIVKPDNASWNPDGRLLVASHRASLMKISSSLGGAGEQPSLLHFVIVEVDPQTLEKRVILDREGEPMGAGTVAVQHGAYLYIGSYTGDRIIKVPLPAGK